MHHIQTRPPEDPARAAFAALPDEPLEHSSALDPSQPAAPVVLLSDSDEPAAEVRYVRASLGGHPCGWAVFDLDGKPLLLGPMPAAQRQWATLCDLRGYQWQTALYLSLAAAVKAWVAAGGRTCRSVTRPRYRYCIDIYRGRHPIIAVGELPDALEEGSVDADVWASLAGPMRWRITDIFGRPIFDDRSHETLLGLRSAWQQAKAAGEVVLP